MLDRTDHIEASYILRAPRDRAWHAISDAQQFATWFGSEIDGQFAAAALLTGRITATRVDAGIGRAQKPYLGTTFELSVDRVEPMRWFSFDWHPLTTGQGAAYPAEPRTLVTFRLREAGTAGDVELTITESGTGQAPRRAGTGQPSTDKPWTEQPWTEQAVSRCLWRPREMTLLIEKFLEGAMDQRPSRPA
jgi:uncharacterized protein YndB with AHSA1/START domain